ncbi:baseplate multidomain protein megatron [Methylorubrum thiocyanatum]|uniref:baseplate multidomain protein megatron n=1 Tax=Methylorubrum thiocyanatum TaxID=47958 RepID=UPI003F7DFD24
MTTLVLQTAGEAVGNALGGPIGGMIGRVAGAAGGAALDDALFGTGTSPRFVDGPRLSELGGLASTEGAPMPRVYGRARIGGTLIWATRPLEVANTTVERSRSGAKGGGGGQKTVRTAYSYFANLAVGLCAGEIALVRRIWADGTELDLTTLAFRIHTGSAAQEPDPLIVAKEGAENAPAYRGLAYIVFERLPLAAFGNRIPQFAFEVIRPVAGLADRIRAVCLIPGSTEFGLDPLAVSEDAGLGSTKPANRFQLQGASDVVASLDALQALCPHLARVSVVTSWFGDDLRAGHCTVTPRVDATVKATTGQPWSVAGLTRATAHAVSRAGDTAAYGGTPSDAGLGRLVAELARRGLAVVLYPFVMMDVPAGNALPDPYRAGAVQAAYPWRGRITCDPAPDRPGSPDGAAAAADQVAAFFTGPRGYGAMIRHYAGLAAGWAAAGAGLAGFVLGSEFVGLTRVRGPADSYPAVDHLRRLATEVRARLGAGVSLVYAADWTEYGAHVRAGGASLRFPLDPLFADPAIDAVGIDYYPPLTDWRDGSDHRDAAEAASPYDRAYLKSRLGAGEAFDWYYASPEDRAAQRRTPITDGAYGKPWIYRAKDLVAWWSNPHVEREGGVETGATAWVPRGKPIWLTEIGIPAVDRGTNGPNVFPDPKSSENARPPFSRGTRDDLIQARGLDAVLSRFDPQTDGFEPAHNPISPLYGGRMIAAEDIFVWAWDARPFPAFPDFTSVWSDAANWALGHWITGRIEGLELDRLVAAILADLGIDAPLDIDAAGFLDGAVLDRPLSAREALEPLARLFGLDVSVTAGRLRIRDGRSRAPAVIDAGDLVLGEEDAPLRRVRAQESELPRALAIGFSDSESPDYRRATAAAARPAGGRRQEVRVEAAVVTRREAAQALAETVLDTALAGRDTAAFGVSPYRIDLEPGDLVVLPGDTRGTLHRITRIDDGPTGRRIETRGVPLPRPDPVSAASLPRPGRMPPALPGPVFALPLVLPVERGDPVPLSYLAVSADPWPGAVAVWRAAGEGAPFGLHRSLDHPACLGRTLTPLPPGPLWCFDRNARLDVALRHADGLSSIGEAAALAGGNLFALLGADGAAEILSAAKAELIGAGTWRLSGLLRGLAGSEAAAGRRAEAGSLIVRLDDGAVGPLVDRIDEAGRRFLYRVGPAERDPADPSVVGFAATADLTAFLPLSPVHLRAHREAEGIRLSWTRRARRDADAWEPADIPLDADSQGYRVDILGQEGRTLRSLTAEATSALYAGADEIADFGTALTEIAFSVAQLGRLAGPGPARRARVSLRT